MTDEKDFGHGDIPTTAQLSPITVQRSRRSTSTVRLNPAGASDMILSAVEFASNARMGR
jgi:hypothetical protein